MEYNRNEKSAKDRIKRERNTDAKKFDRILDRAKIRDAKIRAQATRPKVQSESVRTITMQPDLDRLIDRVINNKSYKRAIRYYLDMRRKKPGQARKNAVAAAQHTGADFRNLEKVFHDQIKKGKLPKHLAWRKDLIEEKISNIIKEKVE